MTDSTRPAPVTPYTRVFNYSGAYDSDAYAADEGHAWDRLAAIAGEFQRGERDWSSARALVDNTTAEVEARYAARLAREAVAAIPPDTDTVEAAGLDGTGRTGGPYSWDDVHRAHLSRHMSEVFAALESMRDYWTRNNLPADYLTGPTFPFPRDLAEHAAEVQHAALILNPNN